MKIGIFGRGRLATVIAQAAGPDLAFCVGRSGTPLATADVIIDASQGPAVSTHLDWALDHRCDFVIGTTGWEIPDLAARVGDRIGVVVAPNFSLGVALLRRLSLVLARFCALDPQRDPYLVEHHQAKKHDAPSGTAKLLAATLLDGCPRKTGWAIGGPLRPDQLSVAVVRAGSTYSEHRVGMDAPAEVLELVHTARSAAAFADGALAAAAWIRRRKGVFTMDDVARHLLDPLFAGLGGGAA